MGWGDFGSNGSVHWSIGYEGNNPKDKESQADHIDFDDQVKHPGKGGVDPRPEIGGSGNQNHAGSFRVTMRFQTNQALVTAVQNANKNGTDLVIDVPVRPFDKVKGSPGKHDTWEITVDW